LKADLPLQDRERRRPHRPSASGAGTRSCGSGRSKTRTCPCAMSVTTAKAHVGQRTASARTIITCLPHGHGLAAFQPPRPANVAARSEARGPLAASASSEPPSGPRRLVCQRWRERPWFRNIEQRRERTCVRRPKSFVLTDHCRPRIRSGCRGLIS